MDPTSRKPKPSPSTNTAAAKNHRHPHPTKHPLPDLSAAAAPPSTIHAISQRFSKLHTNHKKPDPNLYQTSCPTLTKSMEKDDVKKQSFKKDPKMSCFDEIAVKQGLKLTVDEEKIKEFQKGVENEMRGRNSLSSIPPSQSGGRRRSFCNSHLELADFFSCSGVKVVAVDMPPFMQIHAVNCARKALDSLEKFTSKTLAFTLKKEFDGVYGVAWHCIVGTSFGSFVTHSMGGFMYFSMDEKLYILLFKTAVQRAE